jgi:hypothetical protein
MSTLSRFPPSTAPIRPIKGVQLSVWDPDEVVSGAAQPYGIPPCRLPPPAAPSPCAGPPPGAQAPPASRGSGARATPRALIAA